MLLYDLALKKMSIKTIILRMKISILINIKIKKTTQNVVELI